MSYDVAVIGGGITGLGIARLAARNGLTVLVVERSDLASGASSATSHMLHGGLRYLEHGHFRLVREALAERAALSRMAPELAKPVRFLVPFYRGDRRPAWMVRAGLALYDAFAGSRRLAPHSTAGRRATLALEPELEPRDLRGCGLYTDAVMDDARLAITVARDAAQHGAVLQPHTELVGARPAGDGAIELITRDRLDSIERRFEARIIVNAAGPWADAVRVLLARSLRPGTPDPAPVMRPTRGVHLVCPALTRGHGLVVFARADGRVFFVVPFGAHSLVGTTEVEVPSPPPAEAWAPSIDEVRYLRAELKRVLPRPSEQPVFGLLSGLRPLVAAEADAAGSGEVGAFSREHRVIDDGPVLTVVGGKYTTFRVMARDTLARALPKLGRPAFHLVDSTEALPRPRPFAASRTVEELAEYAVDVEFARRLEDVIRRRTPLWLMADRGRVAAPLIAAAMGRKLGWSAERVRAELDVFHAGLEREERLLRAGREER